MKTCDVITFRNSKGETVTAPNTISDDLVRLYNYSKEAANKIVEDLVNINSTGQYSFGSWINSRTIEEATINYYTDGNGLPTAQAVVAYIKHLKNQTATLKDQIIFPDGTVNKILSLEVLQAYAPIFFAEVQSNGITFNHILNGEVIPDEIYKAAFDSLLEDLDIYKETAQLNNEVGKAKELDFLIKNIQQNPYYFQSAFNKFLSNFDIKATESFKEVVDTIENQSEEIVDEQKDVLEGDEELTDLENEENETVVSRDSTFYDSKMKVNYKVQAPKAIRLMFTTMMDVEVELKDPNSKKTQFSRDDFEVYALQDGMSGLTKVAQANKLMSLVHNVLADVPGNIDAHIAALKKQADIFYTSADTALLGAQLDNIIKRIDIYTKGSKLQTEIEALKKNPPKSLNDISDIFYRELLRTQWVQQFTKTNNRYYSTLYNEAKQLNRYNLNNQAIQTRIISEWQARLSDNIVKAGGITEFRKELNALIKKRATLKAVDINKQILEKLGIIIPNIDSYLKIDIDGLPTKGNNNALSVFTGAIIRFGLGSDLAIKNLYNFRQQSDIRTKARKFALLIAQYSTKDIDLVSYNMDGERVYSIGLHNSMTLTAAKYTQRLSGVNRLTTATRNAQIKALEDDINVDMSLQAKAPALWTSLIMEKPLQLVINIENGLGKERSAEKLSTRKLNPIDRLILDMKTVANNASPLLQAGDRPVYMSVSVVNKLDIPESIGASNQKLQISRIKNSIKYELLQSKKYFDENIGRGLKNVDHSDFRMFKGLAAKLGMTMEEIVNLPLADAPTVYTQQASVFNESKYESKVDEFIDELVIRNLEGIRETLVSFKINIEKSPLFKFVENAYQTDRANGFKSFVLAQLANYAEQVRIFTGDAALFKDAADFAKRYMTLNSTKKIQRIDDSINALIELTQLMPSFENKDKGNNASWRAYAQKIITEGRTPTITIKEPTTTMEKANFDSMVGYTADLYRAQGIKNPEQEARKKLAPYAEEYEYADGIGMITLDAYRRLALRTETWSKYHENIYQAVLNNRPIAKSDLQSARFTPLKLQYSGPYMTEAHKGGGFVAVRKYAVMPLIPGIVKEGTPMDSLMQSMHRNKIEQAILESGAKVTYGKTYSIENFEEEFTQAINEDMYSATDDLHDAYMGIQTNLNEQPKGSVTQSKQMRRHTLLNIKDRGKFLSENSEFQNLFDSYDKKHADLVNEKFTDFIDDIGFENIDSIGSWEKADLTRFINQAVYAAEKRNFPNSTIQTINQLKEIDEELKEREITFLDELPIFHELEYLVTKIFKDSVVSLKRNGESFMQVPDLGNSIDSSRSLQFYRVTDAKTILPMEITMPLPDELFDYVANKYGNGKFTQEALDKFNEDVRKDEDAFVANKGKKMTTLTKIRRVVGFRIPHQAKSFTETAHVVEYTNPILFNSVTVPHELVIKNNSDFDSDKFNTYTTEFSIQDNKIVIAENSVMNDLLDIEYKINLLYDTFAEHIIPANDSLLADTATKIATDLKGIDLVKQPMENLLNIAKQIETFTKYKEGKGNVGINVSNVSLLPVIQNNNFIHADKKGFLSYVLDDTGGVNYYDFSNITTQEGYLKSQLLDEFTTASLDAANTTGYPFFINLYGQGLSAALAGVHLGSFNKTLLWLNQPIITEYLRQYSFHNRGISSAKASKQIIQARLLKGYMTLEQYKNLTPDSSVKITIKDLQMAIKNPNTDKAKYIQAVALKVFDALNGLNSEIYDIKKETSADDTGYKTFQELQAKESELNPTGIRSIPKDLKFIQALKSSIKGLQDKLRFTTMSTNMGIDYASLEEALLKKDFNLKFNAKNRNKLFNAFRSQFTPIAISSSFLPGTGFDYVREVERLTTGENSVARRLYEIQNDPDNAYARDLFLSQFQPLIDYQGSGRDIVVSRMSDSNVVDQNIIDAKHDELMQSEYGDLARDLIRLSLVQSGFLQGKFNLMRNLNKQLVYQELLPYISQVKEIILSDNAVLKSNIQEGYMPAFMYAYVHNMPISSQTVEIYNPYLKDMSIVPGTSKKVFTTYSLGKEDARKRLEEGSEYVSTNSDVFIKEIVIRGKKFMIPGSKTKGKALAPFNPDVYADLLEVGKKRKKDC